MGCWFKELVCSVGFARTVEYSPLPLSLFLRLSLTRSDLYHHSNPFSPLLSHLPFCTSSDHKAHPRALALSLYTFLFYPSPHSFSSLLLNLPPFFSLTYPDPSPILIPFNLTLPKSRPSSYILCLRPSILSQPLPSLPFHPILTTPFHPPHEKGSKPRSRANHHHRLRRSVQEHVVFIRLLGDVSCERRGWWSANREIACELLVATSLLATYVLWLRYVDTMMI